MRQGYLVYGCEGSGTRMFTRMLIAAGAVGDGDHGQKFDGGLPTASETSRAIVWRRSWPHAHKTPDVASMASEMRSAGWSPYGFVIVRDTVANVRAQVPDHARTVDEAWRKNQQMFALMFRGLYDADVPYEVVTYENIVTRSEDMQDYLSYLPGLTVPEDYAAVSDANAKHWMKWRQSHPRPVE